MAQPKPRKRPVQQRSRATVQAMVQAAARILADGGVQALTTNEVARVAGVSIGTLYQYFPDKDAIVVGLIEYQLELDRIRFEAALRSVSSYPLRQQIALVAESMCEHQKTIAPMLAQLLPLLPRLESEALVHRMFSGMAQTLVEVIAVAREQLRPELSDERELDHAMFVLTHGIRGALNAAVSHEPERLADPAFAGQIAALMQRTLIPDG